MSKIAHKGQQCQLACLLKLGNLHNVIATALHNTKFMFVKQTYFQYANGVDIDQKLKQKTSKLSQSNINLRITL